MFHKYVLVSGVSIHLLNSVMGLSGGTCSSQLGLVFLQLEWKIKTESVFSFFIYERKLCDFTENNSFENLGLSKEKLL